MSGSLECWHELIQNQHISQENKNLTKDKQRNKNHKLCLQIKNMNYYFIDFKCLKITY